MPLLFIELAKFKEIKFLYEFFKLNLFILPYRFWLFLILFLILLFLLFLRYLTLIILNLHWRLRPKMHTFILRLLFLVPTALFISLKLLSISLGRLFRLFSDHFYYLVLGSLNTNMR